MIFIPYIFGGHDSPQWVMASSFTRFIDHTQRRTTVGRTALDEWSARRRDLYLTAHNTHNRQTFMPPVGFEPTISACERPQAHPLDRAATGPDATSYMNYLHYLLTLILYTAFYINLHSLNIFHRCESKTIGSPCFIMELYIVLCSAMPTGRRDIPNSVFVRIPI